MHPTFPFLVGQVIGERIEQTSLLVGNDLLLVKISGLSFKECPSFTEQLNFNQ